MPLRNADPIAPSDVPPVIAPPPVRSDFWSNFRDLGGLPAAGGRQSRPGVLFRSGNWSTLTLHDHEALGALRIGRVFDFRTTEEADRAPSLLPAGVVREHLPVDGGQLSMQAVDDALIAGEPERIDPAHLVQANRDFIVHHTAVWRGFLHSLLDGPDVPVVFHCTAGKDRTGLAAALLLSAIGVEPAMIWRDYLASNVARVVINRRILAQVRANVAVRAGSARAAAVDLSAVENLLTVREAYLQAAFDAIEHLHGGLPAYLGQALGLSPAMRRELRRRYIE